MSRCRKIISLLVLALTLAAAARAIDVSFYAIEKVAFFNQTSTNTYAAPSSNSFAFEALVLSTNQYAVTNVSFNRQNAVSYAMTNADSYVWRYEQFFNSQTALETAFPASLGPVAYSYNFILKSTNDGTHVQTLSYATGIGYTPVPQLTNWTAAQSVDHTLPFTLRWNNLATTTYAATSNDIFSVNLLVGTNVIYYSPTVGTSNALNGTNTFVTIPAYTLPAGTNLTGHLTITHFAGNAVTNYSFGVPALAIDTKFNLTTRAAPAAPQLTFLNRTNQLTRLQVTGETNRTYVLQATTNFTGWTNIFTTTNASFFYTNNTTNIPQRLYRVRVGS